MSIINSKMIQNAQTSISLGDNILTYNVDTLVCAINGTSTSFIIQFEGSLDAINYFPISGTKLSDPAIYSITTSVMNEAWEFDVSALASFRANVTAIANGNVSVVANSFN